jgi:hypothetical protein
VNHSEYDVDVAQTILRTVMLARMAHTSNPIPNDLFSRFHLAPERSYAAVKSEAQPRIGPQYELWATRCGATGVQYEYNVITFHDFWHLW